MSKNITKVKVSENEMWIVYHSTPIIKIRLDSMGKPILYQLNTGGWTTRSTIQKINKYSPAKVVTRKGKMYIQFCSDWVEFEEGMYVCKDGNPLTYVTEELKF